MYRGQITTIVIFKDEANPFGLKPSYQVMTFVVWFRVMFFFWFGWFFRVFWMTSERWVFMDFVFSSSFAT